jgi:hypothetical protein
MAAEQTTGAGRQTISLEELRDATASAVSPSDKKAITDFRRYAEVEEVFDSEFRRELGKLAERLEVTDSYLLAVGRDGSELQLGTSGSGEKLGWLCYDDGDRYAFSLNEKNIGRFSIDGETLQDNLNTIALILTGKIPVPGQARQRSRYTHGAKFINIPRCQDQVDSSAQVIHEELTSGGGGMVDDYKRDFQGRTDSAAESFLLARSFDGAAVTSELRLTADGTTVVVEEGRERSAATAADYYPFTHVPLTTIYDRVDAVRDLLEDGGINSDGWSGFDSYDSDLDGKPVLDMRSVL